MSSNPSTHAVRIVWLPVNQAWTVLWYDQHLAGPFNRKADAVAYVESLKD